jgi:hypothetical protein
MPSIAHASTNRGPALALRVQAVDIPIRPWPIGLGIFGVPPPWDDVSTGAILESEHGADSATSVAWGESVESHK